LRLPQEKIAPDTRALKTATNAAAGDCAERDSTSSLQIVRPINMAANKAAGERKPEAYPQGYVEDLS
jgi:hypothetical protein